MSKLDDAQQRAADVADKIDALKAAIAHRRAGMASARVKALAKPGKGGLATGWFGAWSRQAGTLAQTIAKLDRLEKRLPGLVDKVRRAKVVAAKQGRRDAFVASMLVRLDALTEYGPAITKRWKVERKAEKKRIKAIKAKLRARHAEAPVKVAPEPTREQWLAPTVVQPVDVTAGFTPSVRRYTTLALLDGDPLPPYWNARHVGARLIEAHRVVRMMPESIGPRAFGKAWPEYINPPEADAEQEAGRYRPRASSVEIARALEAIAWPIQFLSNRGRYAVAFLNYWAAEAESADAPNTPRELLKVISDAMNAAKEPVR